MVEQLLRRLYLTSLVQISVCMCACRVHSSKTSKLSSTGSLEASQGRPSTEQRPCVWRAPSARRPPFSVSSTSAAATTHRSSLTDAATRCGFYRRSRKEPSDQIWVSCWILNHPFTTDNPVALTVFRLVRAIWWPLNPEWTERDYPCCLYPSDLLLISSCSNNGTTFPPFLSSSSSSTW